MATEEEIISSQMWLRDCLNLLQVNYPYIFDSVFLFFICESIWRWTDLKTLWRNFQIPLVHHEENEYNESKRKKTLIYKILLYLLLLKLSIEKCIENQVSLSLVYLYIVCFDRKQFNCFLYSSWREREKERERVISRNLTQTEPFINFV